MTERVLILVLFSLHAFLAFPVFATGACDHALLAITTILVSLLLGCKEEWSLPESYIHKSITGKLLDLTTFYVNAAGATHSITQTLPSLRTAGSALQTCPSGCLLLLAGLLNKPAVAGETM